MDTNFRNSLNNMNAHFKKVTALAAFRNRMGNIKQGKKQVAPQLTDVQAVIKGPKLTKAGLKK